MALPSALGWLDVSTLTGWAVQRPAGPTLTARAGRSCPRAGSSFCMAFYEKSERWRIDISAGDLCALGDCVDGLGEGARAQVHRLC